MVDTNAMFAPILRALWWLFWGLIPLAFVAILFRTAWFKGLIGEAMVNIAARLFLDRRLYHLIKNVTIPVEDGTTQIDHVIVSRFGVFVVETKNMKGWIFGCERQKTWTQVIYKSKHQFQNPLHQNYKHAKALEAALGLSPEKIIPLVVFVGNSEFKTRMPANVVQGMGFIRFIKSHAKVLPTEAEVRETVEKIAEGRLEPSLQTHLQHVQHVKGIVAAKQRPAQVPPAKRCPTCGNEMVLRTARKGDHAGKKFWGCSAFPKCRTTMACD